MFRDAGKRMVESIFRAEDLSFVLCSNLYRTENHSQFESLPRGSSESYFELKAQDRWQLSNAESFACFLVQSLFIRANELAWLRVRFT